MYWMGSITLVLSGIFFLPIFYKLKATSVYEYLEKRYDSKLLRQIGALLFLMNTWFMMAVVMYAPAIALNGVTHSPLWHYILVRYFPFGMGGLVA
jgi:SSS family solute:Na+ symporter